MDEDDMDQSHLLQNMAEFNNKTRQKKKIREKKKKYF